MQFLSPPSRFELYNFVAHVSRWWHFFPPYLRYSVRKIHIEWLCCNIRAPRVYCSHFLVIVIVFISSDFLLLIDRSKVSNFWARSHSKTSSQGGERRPLRPVKKRGRRRHNHPDTRQVGAAHGLRQRRNFPSPRNVRKGLDFGVCSTGNGMWETPVCALARCPRRRQGLCLELSHLRFTLLFRQERVACPGDPPNP